MDVVVDGLMVVQQRRDPNSGSEDLQTYSWAMVGLGGVIGSLVGGYFTEWGWDRWCFFGKGTVGLLISVAGSTIPLALEQDPTEIINCSLWTRTKANARDVWNGSKLPELYRSILYFIIMGSTIPYFGTFLYYY